MVENMVYPYLQKQGWFIKHLMNVAQLLNNEEAMPIGLLAIGFCQPCLFQFTLGNRDG